MSLNFCSSVSVVKLELQLVTKSLGVAAQTLTFRLDRLWPSSL